MTQKVVVLGNLPLATKIIKLIYSMENVELVGVVHPGIITTYPDSDNEICATEYCQKHNIKKLTIEDIYKIKDLTLAISARNNTILSKHFIELFEIGVVNCHGGYLPEYKGVGGHIFPILNEEQYSGGTIHWMNDKIDDGRIIDREKVFINENDTGLDLYIKINDVIYSMINKNIKKILSGDLQGTEQIKLKPLNKMKRSYYFYQKDIKELLNYESWTGVMNRALHWPGKKSK